MRMLCHLLIAASMALLLSCADEGFRPGPSQEIRDFVNGQRLPSLRAVRIVLFLERFDLSVFRATYGMPNEVYPTAYGMRFGEKIGWIHLDDPELDIAHLTFFDVAPEDTQLCEPGLWSEMKAADQWTYWAAFLPTLAADPDTPTSALVSMSTQLRTYISPHIAWNLLANPKAQGECDVLTILSGLPVFQGDAYAPIRSRASELLEIAGCQ